MLLAYPLWHTQAGAWQQNDGNVTHFNDNVEAIHLVGYVGDILLMFGDIIYKKEVYYVS